MKRIAALVGVLLLVAGSAVMGGAVVQRDPIVTGAGSASNADAQLVRNGNGFSVQGTVRDLTPGNVHSVWWIVIEADDPTPDGFPLVLNATGGIADNNGELHFGAGLPAAEYEDGDVVPRRVFSGGDVDDPLTALVVFHVLDHGPPIPGEIHQQMTTVDHGCDPGCPLATEIVFPP